MTDEFVALKNFAFKKSRLLSFGLAWEKRDDEPHLGLQLVLEQPDKASKVTLFGESASDTLQMHADLMVAVGSYEQRNEIIARMAKELGVDLVAKPQTSPHPSDMFTKESTEVDR